MTKIPVGATIAHAYRFAFRDFFKLLGVMWVPWAIMMAGGFLVMKPMMAVSAAMAGQDFSTIRHALIFIAPFYLLMMVLLFMQIAGVTELALGLKTGSPYYYFSLGKPFWRVVGAFLVTVAVMIASYIPIVIGAIAIALAGVVITTILGAHAVYWIVALVGVFIFGAYVYIFARTCFLLIPIAIAEQKISIKRAWSLARGNSWRIFLILLSLIVPAMALEFAFVFSFMLHGMPQLAPPHATPQQLAAFQANIAAWNTANMGRVMSNWYWIYPLGGAFSVLFLGLSCGAQAFAYRALTQDETAVQHPGPWQTP